MVLDDKHWMSGEKQAFEAEELVGSAHPDMVESCQVGARLPCFFG
jgi:hypothetical protein